MSVVLWNELGVEIPIASVSVPPVLYPLPDALLEAYPPMTAGYIATSSTGLSPFTSTFVFVLVLRGCGGFGGVVGVIVGGGRWYWP